MSKDDIFEDWKKNRFIVATVDEVHQGILVVMTDIKYWVNNAEELVEWCQENNCITKGMTIEIPDEETLLLFRLKWS